MAEQLLIYAPLAQAASTLEELFTLVMRKDQGFLVTLSAEPAPRDRMRFHAKGGPDNYVRMPPLAKEGFLEAWHSNHRDSYFRCAKVRLSTADSGGGQGDIAANPADRAPRDGSGDGAGPAPRPRDGEDSPHPGESCLLTWDPADIRIDLGREWTAFFEALARLLPVERRMILLQNDPLYLPPVIVDEVHLYTSLPEVDRATRQRLDTIFAPGSLRYERIADQHEGSDLVRYRIQGDLHDGGDFGEIWLRAGGPEWTAAFLCALPLSQEPPANEVQAVFALPPEAQRPALALLKARYAAARDENVRSKTGYLNVIWAGYRKSLPPHWIFLVRADVAAELARSASRLTEIEAFVVEKWCEGLTCPEIAALRGRKPAYINNMISELRKRLGEELVPKHSPARRPRSR